MTSRSDRVLVSVKVTLSLCHRYLALVTTSITYTALSKLSTRVRHQVHPTVGESPTSCIASLVLTVVAFMEPVNVIISISQSVTASLCNMFLVFSKLGFQTCYADQRNSYLPPFSDCYISPTR